MKYLCSVWGCWLLMAMVLPPPPAPSRGRATVRVRGGPTVLVVNAFTQPTTSGWPWSLAELHQQVMKKLQKQLGSRVTVVAAADPAGAAKVYTLHLEMTRFWQENETTELAGGVQQSIQNGEGHSWMTDANGRKMFDRKDQFHSATEGSYAQIDYASSGPMANDIAIEVAAHVAAAKVF